jgi:hypothetical protein
MPDHTDSPPFDLRGQLIRIDKMHSDIQLKLTDIDKMLSDIRRNEAERDRRKHAPWLTAIAGLTAGAALLGAGGAIGALLVKLFEAAPVAH